MEHDPDHQPTSRETHHETEIGSGTSTKRWNMNKDEWETLSDDEARRSKPKAQLADFIQSSDELVVATAAIERLKEDGFIESFDGGLSLFLRRAGVEEASRRESLADNTTVEAERAARDAMLRWFWENRYRIPRLSASRNWTLEQFYGSPLCIYNGIPFSGENLRGAVRYLVAKELVEYDHREGARHEWSLPRITDKGVDCVENHGGVVVTYMEHKQGARYETHIHGSVSNSQLAWGDHNEQTIETKGFDAEGVIRLCQAVLEALPLLHFDQPDADEVAALAKLSEAQSAGEQPDPSWVKATLERIAVVLGKAGETALGAVLQALFRTASDAIGLPPGTG